MEPPTSPATPPRRVGLVARLLVLLPVVVSLAYLGFLTIQLGPAVVDLDLAAFVRGYERILGPAELAGAPLRSAGGGADRIVLLTTQSERTVPVRPRTGVRMRDMLHVDLWAFDTATARPAWRRRIRTFEDRRPLDHEVLGADGATLWLFVREPLAVSLRDGAVVADGARLEARNPALAGKRVDEDGFVAFGAQGLQLTLSDSRQWIVAGDDLRALPRDVAPATRGGIVAPARVGAATHEFQVRGLHLGTRWLGVLTDDEATTLRQPPVVPGAAPGESRGAMAEALERQHVPPDLVVQPRPYRLWSAVVTQVSAAPRDWPAELPDRWGTRDRFGDYAPLPDTPPFLQAGLLGDGRASRPFWYRAPDSVLVLHHDKVGGAGRLQLARVAGPNGHVVWDAPLTLATLEASMFGETTLAFLGSTPNPAHDPRVATSRERHQVLVAVHVPSGAVATYDLTAESVRDDDGDGTAPETAGGPWNVE